MARAAGPRLTARLRLDLALSPGLRTTAGLFLQHVRPRGIGERRMLLAADRRWPHLFAGALAQPGGPVRPPAALVPACRVQPSLRRRRRLLVDPEGALLRARIVDHA